MQAAPTKCYVYQSDPPPENQRLGGKKPRIYALGGPGSEQLRTNRYTEEEAGKMAELINAAGQVEPCCECGEDYPRAELLMGELYCKTCRVEEAARVVARKGK